ncbi:DUF692 domain-containing protein [Halopseudomonas aestusnigri]|uniref:MNIO family bufferin maturase n=1 Tax=Halopseudomonas aestusnigri TaxID=857252 RepID=UPI002552520C|nr:DUF692 domain-containing protein [Halopseudomonas aestusnigri]MDL2198008.1 DUF692 domain-containing protein [Halopseudomonas aestusnigri]
MHYFPLTRGAGVGFKPQHFEALLANTSAVDLLEIHAENYFGEGGILHHQLEQLQTELPLSIHGVGLSLGGAEALNPQHLRQLQRLCERYRPALVSEHLAWAFSDGQFLADLLPVVYSSEVLDRTVDHIAQLQDTLGRRILIENPATYLTFAQSELPEAEFLAALVQRSGCGLLLDLNNLLISCHNNGGRVDSYLQTIPLDDVGEVHLAGHSVKPVANGGTLLIDDHGSAVDSATWALYSHFLHIAGSRPTIIEWDNDVPCWSRLVQEVDVARACLLESDRTREATR